MYTCNAVPEAKQSCTDFFVLFRMDNGSNARFKRVLVSFDSPAKIEPSKNCGWGVE